MEQQQQQDFPRREMKVAYAVTERNGRSFWTRIGVAFKNKDDSQTIKLEAVPISGTIQLRDEQPREPWDARVPGGDARGRLPRDTSPDSLS